VRNEKFASLPVWEAALYAAGCHIQDSDGVACGIEWQSGSGRACYTASDAIRIEPLGVALDRGATVEVYWPVGESGYSVDVRQPERF
jgi:hypothetical protein